MSAAARALRAVRPVRLFPGQEAALRRRMLVQLLPFCRVIFFFGAFAAFAGWDLTIYGADAATRALPWRLGVAAALLGFWAASFHPLGERNWPLLRIAAGVTVNVVIAIIAAQTERGSWLGTTGLMFPLAANIVMAPDLRSALVCNVILSLAPLGTMALVGAPGIVMVSTMWFLGTFALLFGIFVYAVEQVRRANLILEDRVRAERARADDLLEAMLPRPVALRLRMGETRIAEEVSRVAVAFVDVVGYTRLSATLPPRGG